MPIPNGGGLIINNQQLKFEVRTIPPQLLSTLSRTVGLFFNWVDLRFYGLGRKLQAAKSKLSTVADRMDIERVPVLDTGFDESKAKWGISKLSRFLINRVRPEQVIARRRENFKFMLQNIAKEFQLLHELPDGAVPWFFRLKFQIVSRFFRNSHVAELIAHVSGGIFMRIFRQINFLRLKNYAKLFWNYRFIRI